MNRLSLFSFIIRIAALVLPEPMIESQTLTENPSLNKTPSFYMYFTSTLLC